MDRRPADNDDTLEMRIDYRNGDVDIIIPQIDKMGLGQELRTQFNQYTFADDLKNPGNHIFTLFVAASKRPAIEAAMARDCPTLKLSFRKPDRIDLTPEEEHAARERLKAKGFDLY